MIFLMRFVLLNALLLSAAEAQAQLIVFQGVMDGNLAIISLGRDITAIELLAKKSKFVPQHIRAGVVNPPFDIATEKKLFKLQPHGFRHVYYGNVLPPGRLAPFNIEGALKHDGSGNNSIDAEGIAVIMTPIGPTTVLSLSAGLRAATVSLWTAANAIGHNMGRS